MTMRRSQRSKSRRQAKKRSGSRSPKKVMSGFTRPPCLAFIASTLAGPDMMAFRTSSTSTCFPVPMHVAESKFPCAETIISLGMPASTSSESIFWVKQRSSSPLSWSRRMKWCATVGLYCPGNNSLAYTHTHR